MRAAIHLAVDAFTDRPDTTYVRDVDSSHSVCCVSCRCRVGPRY